MVNAGIVVAGGDLPRRGILLVGDFGGVSGEYDCVSRVSLRVCFFDSIFPVVGILVGDLSPFSASFLRGAGGAFCGCATCGVSVGDWVPPVGSVPLESA